MDMKIYDPNKQTGTKQHIQVYSVVKVMYAVGCSNAVVQVIIQPLVYKILGGKFCKSSILCCNTNDNGAGGGTARRQQLINRSKRRPKIVYRSEEFGDITDWDIIAGIIGYTWGMVWLYMALAIPHASDKYTFFWITQDILGTCMCITFLGIIQLNSIQVATILLLVAFVYDIFFVFITPYLFSKSIMITVATSGGPPTADPQWCEKYPSDDDCQGGDPLPMLLTFPRIFDYQGGSSLLGLGDIVRKYIFVFCLQK